MSCTRFVSTYWKFCNTTIIVDCSIKAAILLATIFYYWIRAGPCLQLKVLAEFQVCFAYFEYYTAEKPCLKSKNHLIISDWTFINRIIVFGLVAILKTVLSINTICTNGQCYKTNDDESTKFYSAVFIQK